MNKQFPDQVPVQPVERPAPGSDDFDPLQHVWDGTTWRSPGEPSHWWDGARWLPGSPYPIQPSRSSKAYKDPKRRKAARILSGIAHASVLGLVALPMVVFEGACGNIADYNGYQALVGFSLPPVEDYSTLPTIPPAVSFEPNLWIALVVALGLAGVAAAWVGGLRAAMARLATAAIAIIAAWAAIMPYPPSFDYEGYKVYVAAGIGQLAITAVLLSALVADLVSVLIMSNSSPPRDLAQAAAVGDHRRPPGGSSSP